jgi:secondary thiamine-phosphate synthase enzyme
VRELNLKTERKTQLLDITDLVQDALASTNGANAALVYVPHTTAGVTINEDADPALAADIEAAMERIVAEDGGWRHSDADGPNAPSHIRASLMGPHVVVPLRDDGQLALGTWQGIFLCELDGPRTRSVYVTVLQ